MTLDELYEAAAKERYFPRNTSQEMFIENAKMLKNEGFTDFEVQQFAAHEDLNSYAMTQMRLQRVADFDDFARNYYLRFPDKEIPVKEILDVWEQETTLGYLNAGWVFKAGGQPNPFDLLHSYYSDTDPSTISPSRRTQRRKTKDYGTIRGKI